MKSPKLSFLFALALTAMAAPAFAQDAQSRLWDAARAGDTAVIRQAVAEGAKVGELDTRSNQNGRYALNWAVWRNHVDAVKLLIELKAPLDAANRTGFTALHHAAEAGSLESARLLLAAGASAAEMNAAGMTPAEVARQRGHAEIAELIDAAAKK